MRALLPDLDWGAIWPYVAVGGLIAVALGMLFFGNGSKGPPYRGEGE